MRLPSKINWLGLAGGICTLLLIAISGFVPWWQLRVGDSVIAANVSPLYTNFNLAGTVFTVPLLLAINVSCSLLSLICGIGMLIYSIAPSKPYSKTLLGFSYRTPLFFIVVFVVGLAALIFFVSSLFSLNVPLVGLSEVSLPSSTTQGMKVSVLLLAGFLWPFYLAIASAVLCIGARIYHKRILPPADLTAPLSVAMSAPTTPPTK